MTAPEPGATSLQSVDRVLDVLEAFASDGQRDLGISECAALAGINKSTVYRILATFERRGYARQNADTGRYGLTQHWWRIGRATLGGGNVVDVAAPHMRALRDRTGETTQLAIYSGKGYGTYVNVIEGTHAVRSVSPIGLRFPAAATSTGKALLAMQPEAEQQRVARALRRYTDQTLVEPAVLLDELAAIRRDGYAINRGEYRGEVGGIAMPLRLADGTTIAAFGFCIPRFRFEQLDHAELVALLRPARAKIERELGSGDDPS
ncbi:MAG TPA: IclR family transcriptional regulator [Candidatus Sulfotelmatobacter sp.]|nr:IclR family transcriptional regulator [Candidatus Sulfotelmatobacter sp.]